MPIKGLDLRGIPWPKVGDIRKGELVPVIDKATGEQKMNKWGKPTTMPVDLDYFKVVLDSAHPEAQDIFNQIYGDKPRTLRIVLANDDINRVWSYWYEAYIASQMIAKSDGEIMYYWKDPTTYKMKAVLDDKVPMPADLVVGKDKNGEEIKMKATGRLNVVMPELRVAGYLTLHTTSIIDIKAITAHLVGVQEFAHKLGVGIGVVPLVLRRTEQMVSCPKAPNSGEKVRRLKWMLSIEADPDWIAEMFKRTNKMAFLAVPAAPALPASVDLEDLEDTDAPDAYGNDFSLEAETLDGEFVPDLDGEALYEDEPPYIPPPPEEEEQPELLPQVKLTEADLPANMLPIKLAKTVREADKGSKKGRLYWDVPTQELSNKMIGINRLLAKEGITDAQIEDAELKAGAIGTIIWYREHVELEKGGK